MHCMHICHTCAKTSGDEVVNYRQIPDANSRSLHHDDRATGDRGLNGGRIGAEECELSIGPTVNAPPEDDDRRNWMITECQQGTEIGIGGDDSTTFGHSTRKNCLVVSCSQTVITYMDGVVTALSEAFS